MINITKSRGTLEPTSVPLHLSTQPSLFISTLEPHYGYPVQHLPVHVNLELKYIAQLQIGTLSLA